jgi:hypothetical protein
VYGTVLYRVQIIILNDVMNVFHIEPWGEFFVTVPSTLSGLQCSRVPVLIQYCTGTMLYQFRTIVLIGMVNGGILTPMDKFYTGGWKI